MTTTDTLNARIADAVARLAVEFEAPLTTGDTLLLILRSVMEGIDIRSDASLGWERWHESCDA